ncbi:YlzJ-like family protein [Cytobacillus purgationiresistens]|uniref:Uncharacterized protein n=1 Tax=Cytobacillus purgationiresistens TaxID=863449 RepID=A0ABU0AI98_9BACI|nr:YlzJ-like family protein [Cytobacillus purgationiresistens]MDQ0270168.1 hypothetical protein [Cytobacillus purgationiresistens]
MILYTMMPHELVYQAEGQEFDRQRVIDHNGVPLLVEMVEGSDCRVLQIMSSDPNDFLNETLTPGTKITLS